MMSSLANLVLFIALVSTSIIVGVMYRKLKNLDAYNSEYRRAFDESRAALVSAQNAVTSFGAESRETLAMLSARIDEAKALISRLDTLTGQVSSSSKASNA